MNAEMNTGAICYLRDLGWSDSRILTALGGCDEGSVGQEFCKEVLEFLMHEGVNPKQAVSIILERRKRRAIAKSRALHPSNQNRNN